jgi:hypothetical protein
MICLLVDGADAGDLLARDAYSCIERHLAQPPVDAVEHA